MRAFIIHLPQRTDREPNIEAITKLLPEVEVAPGVVPEWETERDARAVRGCSLAHLQLVQAHLAPQQPVLVMEDDAIPHEEGARLWGDLSSRLPADAGIVLLGGETENVGPLVDGFHEVHPPYFGSHAVLYTPALLQARWLMKAYAVLASRRIGDNLCYESVMLLALENSGLKVYRPQVMPFVTSDSFSDREGKAMAARTKTTDLREPRTPIGFIVTVRDESVAQLQQALSSVRAHYPHAPVCVVTDGTTGFKDVAEQFGCRYLEGEQLKLTGKGHLWWQRFAAEAHLQRADTVFKFDPDALLHGRFTEAFPTSGVFGTLTYQGETAEHIQGGVQGFAPDALKALSTTPAGAYPTPGQAQTSDYFSTDFSCVAVMRANNLPMTNYTQISSGWKSVPGPAIATHPHKLQDLPQVTVCLLSWKRTANVEAICQAYEAYSCVKEIIVWNNNPGVTLTASGKTTVVNCSRDLGLDTRFMAALVAKTAVVMSHDDDWLLPEPTVRALVQAWVAAPDVIHGIQGRTPKADNTYATNVEGVTAPCDIVLTTTCVFSKDHAWRVFAARTHPAVKASMALCLKEGTQEHNGEDMLLSYAVKSASGKPNQVHKLPRKELSSENAISSNPAHWRIRTAVMRSAQEAAGLVPGVGMCRLGAPADGGYVLAECGPYDFYVGCGIGNECSFDAALFTKYPALAGVALDGTIQGPPPTFPPRLMWRKHNVAADMPFVEYIPGVSAGLLKMDIEGGEWGWLETVADTTLSKFKQLVFEFHDLHKDTKHKLKLIERISALFNVVNVHANNYGKTFELGGRTWPKVIEVTFLRKDLPVPKWTDLNRPNNPRIPEIAVSQHLLAELKSVCGTRVFASGCFDILHGGHVEFLKAAKALGDHLTVNVASNAVLRAAKGREPAVPLAHKVSLLQALKSVDEVITSSDNEQGTDYRTWFLANKPDILAVTEDDQYADAKKSLCAKVGAKYVVLPKTSAIAPTSTTAIRSNLGKVFGDVYAARKWVNGSGTGSSSEYTVGYRAFLEDYIRQHNVKSVVDVGCGDWQSSKLIDWQGAAYTGLDVAGDVIQRNIENYTRPGVTFLHGDATEVDLPGADLIIVKDVLQHLSNANVRKVLAKLTPFKHALVTNDLTGTGLNSDIADGAWRPVDLRQSPFNQLATVVYEFGTHGKATLSLP